MNIVLILLALLPCSTLGGQSKVDNDKLIEMLLEDVAEMKEDISELQVNEGETNYFIRSHVDDLDDHEKRLQEQEDQVLLHEGDLEEINANLRRLNAVVEEQGEELKRQREALSFQTGEIRLLKERQKGQTELINDLEGITTAVSFQDCEDIQRNLGSNYTEGIYTVYINFVATPVYCDLHGYTVIQSRGQFGNPTTYFYREWQEYLKPFGTPGEEFWLGLENMYKLTTNYKQYGLKIEVEDVEGNKGEGHWNSFSVGDNTYFTLLMGAYDGGNIGDSMAYHNGAKFSTKDRDQDLNGANCAVTFSSAWWFKSCYHSNLNGLNLNSINAPYATSSILYNAWTGTKHSLKSVKMAVKAIS